MTQIIKIGPDIRSQENLTCILCFKNRKECFEYCVTGKAVLKHIELPRIFTTFHSWGICRGCINQMGYLSQACVYDVLVKCTNWPTDLMTIVYQLADLHSVESFEIDTLLLVETLNKKI